jgi:hypothetical protein
MSDEEHKEHEHKPHPDFARGGETEEHDEHDEPRPDFARGAREVEVTTESEQGTFGGGHVHDEPHGDFARGNEEGDDGEGASEPDE